MTRSEEIVLSAIRDITFSKEVSDRSPEYAVSIEVSRHTGLPLDTVSMAAKALERSGMIRIGRTLNYEYYELVQTWK